MTPAKEREKESRHFDAVALDRMTDEQLMREIRFRTNKGLAAMKCDLGNYYFSMSGRRSTSTMNELRAVRNWVKAALERDAPE